MRELKEKTGGMVIMAYWIFKLASTINSSRPVGGEFTWKDAFYIDPLKLIPPVIE